MQDEPIVIEGMLSAGSGVVDGAKSSLRTMRNPSFAIYDNDDGVNRPELGEVFMVVRITPGVIDLRWGKCTEYELKRVDKENRNG